MWSLVSACPISSAFSASITYAASPIPPYPGLTAPWFPPAACGISILVWKSGSKKDQEDSGKSLPHRARSQNRWQTLPLNMAPTHLRGRLPGKVSAMKSDLARWGCRWYHLVVASAFFCSTPEKTCSRPEMTCSRTIICESCAERNHFIRLSCGFQSE